MDKKLIKEHRLSKREVEVANKFEEIKLKNPSKSDVYNLSTALYGEKMSKSSTASLFAAMVSKEDYDVKDKQQIQELVTWLQSIQ